VTITVKEPLAEAAHDIVAFPGAVRKAGDAVHARPLEGVTEDERVTFPVNPLTPTISTNAVTVSPTTRETLFGLALTEKSTTITEIETVLENEPLTALTVTV